MPRKWVVLFFVFFLSKAFALNENSMLKQLAQKEGFFFFYSSSCPHCQTFAPTLKQISQEYGFKVVAISMDGGFLTFFPDALMDNGQSKLFEIHSFPSLFLVNPEKNTANLVTEGSIGKQEVINRLLKIASADKKEGRL